MLYDSLLNREKHLSCSQPSMSSLTCLSLLWLMTESTQLLKARSEHAEVGVGAEFLALECLSLWAPM